MDSYFYTLTAAKVSMAGYLSLVIRSEHRCNMQVKIAGLWFTISHLIPDRFQYIDVAKSEGSNSCLLSSYRCLL